MAYRTTTLTAATAAWQQVFVQVTAAGADSSLSMAVYPEDLDASEWSPAGDLSLTSP